MKLASMKRKIAPVATVLMALVLSGCVSDGGYYEGGPGYRDYPRDGGRVAPPRPPRPDRDYGYGRDRADPPRRDYDRRPPPSIYDERGRGDRDGRYGQRRPDGPNMLPPLPPRNHPDRRDDGNFSIYQYRNG